MLEYEDLNGDELMTYLVGGAHFDEIELLRRLRINAKVSEAFF